MRSGRMETSPLMQMFYRCGVLAHDCISRYWGINDVQSHQMVVGKQKGVRCGCRGNNHINEKVGECRNRSRVHFPQPVVSRP